jgi:hypothetical protein
VAASSLLAVPLQFSAPVDRPDSVIIRVGHRDLSLPPYYTLQDTFKDTFKALPDTLPHFGSFGQL